MKILVVLLMLLQACTGCASVGPSPVQSEASFEWPLWYPPHTSAGTDNPPAPRPPRTMVHIDAAVDSAHAEIWVHQIIAAAVKYDFVTIEMDTPGGSNSAGFRVMKAIEDCGKPTLCIVDGQAQSFGFDLLQSCTMRAMTKRSFLMIHESAFTVVDPVNRHSLQDYYHLAEAVDSGYAEHMARRMNISVREMRRRIHNKEWYLNWREALAYKAVDTVYDDVAVGFIRMQANRAAFTGPWLTHPEP